MTATRRYFLHGREASRRVALAEWLRLAAGHGALQARRTFELAEHGRARPGEVAQAQGELHSRGIVITGVEGI